MLNSSDKASLFLGLSLKEQADLQEKINRFRLSLQNSRKLVEIYTDLTSWSRSAREENQFDKLWQQTMLSNKNSKNTNYKILFSKFTKTFEELKGERAIYKQDGNEKNFKTNVKSKISPVKHDRKPIGLCPVASEKTVCCNLLTIDSIVNCQMGCNYCAIQTMFTKESISIDLNLKEKLDKVKLDPSRRYHIGSGQSSDSLFLGNKFNVLDTLTDFARANSNVFLEFKTKSSNIQYFKEKKNLPKNFFVSWSLNPDIFIQKEELYTASFSGRIEAAQEMVSLGYKIGFHFHPIVNFEGWQDAYQDICSTIINNFSVQDIVFISLGSMTIPRPVAKKIRQARVETQVLKGMTANNPEKKFSYSPEVKQEMFSFVYNALSAFHNKVFFYLCMEESQYWMATMGYSYATNELFEASILDAISLKLHGALSVK